MNIRVTKEFKFEMAHALLGHDGPCKNIHGHSYQLSVTLKGKPINDPSNPKTGMVVDFIDLKKLVNTEIIIPFDHALVLNKNIAGKVHSGLHEQKLILVDFQPTCENLVIYFAGRLKKVIPPDILLHHLLLKETSTSFAEWYAEDNE
ncbi:MAG: 6-pyruvoyl trahydropterin synthase family protein [Bacteroidia bacterium]